ncbi:MAG: hypothetical protein C5B48_13325 [Candidatus Rokuibacteriota bacterium]|nr:MAG: hypothetical protein C5B48_13325 [Candidatus Rokubacteria bacterium]
MAKPNGEAALTAIGCPGCAGVLTAIDEGRRDYVSYVCTIGHSYSLFDLLDAKEQQFEHGLWSLLSVLAHLEMAYHRLLEHVDQGGARISKEPVEGRLRQVQDDARRIRELVEQDQPPDLGLDGRTRSP